MGRIAPLWLATGCAVLMIVAAQARGDGEAPRPAPSAQPDWNAWTRPLAPGSPDANPAPPDAAPEAQPEPAHDEIDVVDAHWMALTMWGEGRGEGEEGMRAVGHVIRNRWAARRHGTYVTDTVSAAWQFSAWNEGDPNRALMLDIEALPPGSREHRLWLAAKRLSADILAGRSADPTGGALFYHTTAVAPAWSRGLSPTARIGEHLFFAAAR